MASATVVSPCPVVAHPEPDSKDHLVCKMDSFTRKIPGNVGGLFKVIAMILPQVRVVDGRHVLVLQAGRRHGAFPVSPTLNTALCLQIFAWTFNVFDLCKEAQERPLVVVVMALLEAEGLLVCPARHNEQLFTDLPLYYH